MCVPAQEAATDERISGPDWGNWVSEGAYRRDASARAHPCSTSLPAEPGGPELQQPPLCQAGDVAAPVVTAGLSPLRPVAAGGPSAHAHLSLGALGGLCPCRAPRAPRGVPSAAPAPSSPSCAPTSQQRQLPMGVNQKLLARLPVPRPCVITGSGSEFIQLFAQISSAPFHAAHVTRHTAARSHAAGGPR